MSEIRIFTQLQLNPNLVNCFDCFASENNFYIVMEYCNQGTLKD